MIAAFATQAQIKLPPNFHWKVKNIDGSGTAVDNSKFFDNDDADEQSRAELCAASKAIYFANKTKEALGLSSILLNLNVDAQWLTYQDHSGQKGYKLTQQARKNNIRLNVIWLPGVENPADKWTVASGYKRYQDNDFALLVKLIK